MRSQPRPPWPARAALPRRRTSAGRGGGRRVSKRALNPLFPLTVPGWSRSGCSEGMEMPRSTAVGWLKASLICRGQRMMGGHANFFHVPLSPARPHRSHVGDLLGRGGVLVARARLGAPLRRRVCGRNGSSSRAASSSSLRDRGDRRHRLLVQLKRGRGVIRGWATTTTTPLTWSW